MAGRIRFFEIFYEILCVGILALKIHIIKKKKMHTCLIYKTPSTDRLGPVGSYPCEKSQEWGTNPTELRPCGTEPSHAN